MNEYKFIGSVFGHAVRTNGKTYRFGCGAVVLPIKTVDNFLIELERRFPSKKRTKEEADFEKVMSHINSRGYKMDAHVAANIFKLFNYAKKKPTADPVKKVVKAAPKKKPAPKKKAAKKK